MPGHVVRAWLGNTEAVRMLLEMVREETRRLIGRYVESPLIARESLPIDEALLKQLAPTPERWR